MQGTKRPADGLKEMVLWSPGANQGGWAQKRARGAEPLPPGLM